MQETSTSCSKTSITPVTTKQYIALNRQRFSKLLNENKPLAIAAISTHTKQVARIFEDGKNGNGSKIGSYNSSQELYVSPNTAPRAIPLRGKTGKSTFKSGKKHVTGYFISYKAFRAQQGRQTSFVDFIMFGNLRSDYSTPPVKLNKTKFVAGTSRDENSKKIGGLEDKFGRVFTKLTKAEILHFKKVLTDQTLKVLTA